MDLCFLGCAAQLLRESYSLVPRLLGPSVNSMRIPAARCPAIRNPLSHIFHCSHCTFVTTLLRLFIWLLLNLPLRKRALLGGFTSRFGLIKLTFGRMPTVTKQFSANSFQEVSACLSIDLPRRTPASEAPFSPRTSTSWCWWLRGWSGFRC